MIPLLRRVLIGAFFLCALPALADVARPDTQMDTLHLMQQAFQAAPEVETVDLDPADQSLRVEFRDGGEFTSYPDNLHKTLQIAEDDAERQEMLDDFVAAMVGQMSRLDDGSPDINIVLPVIRPVEFGIDATQAGTLVSHDFVADMRVYYVFNYPKTIGYVTKDQMQQMGLGAEGLKARAMLNLQDTDWRPRIEGDGLYLVALDGTFEASLLLLDDLWRGIDEQLGTLILAPIARDLIVFTDADWPNAQEALQDLAANDPANSAYPLSSSVLEWQNDGWHIHDAAQ